MSDFQNQMNHAVQGFVAQIADLARRAALDTLVSAFGSRRDGGRNGSGRVALLALTGGGRRGRPRGGGGPKRTAADLDMLAEKFASYIKANPGLRIEQINKELGTMTKDLALPIRKLIADGNITTKGQKRSTKYFASKRTSKHW
jgi:hypothetical protein